MNKTKLVCVYNNRDIFFKVVKSNNHIGSCELFAFDNTLENAPITRLYNKFIDENIIKSDVMLNSFQHLIDERQCDPACPADGGNGSSERRDDDFWCCFIHQDFGFMENVDLVVEKLNPNYIYGPVGVKIFKGLFWGKRHDVECVKRGFKTELKLTFGRILQGGDDFGLKKHGRLALFQPTVDAIDCCCIIVHSSLLRKYNLRFDEHLNFHMYAEELCYRAKKDYKIKTKVIQTKCFHLGKGCLDDDYQKSVQYLKEKFNIKRIPSTCPN